MTPIFRTRPEDAHVVAAMRVGEVWLSSLPLVDGPSGLFARLSWADGRSAAALLGGRLPTPHELDEGLAAGVLLHPVTLPSLNMVPHGVDPQTLRVSQMMGREWCATHDNRVRRQLADLGWDGQQHVASVGKHWVEGSDHAGHFPPSGWAALYGWYRSRRPGDLWQPLNDGRPKPLRHDAATYTDYGTLTHVVWDHDPGAGDLVALAQALGQIEKVT